MKTILIECNENDETNDGCKQEQTAGVNDRGNPEYFFGMSVTCV